MTYLELPRDILKVVALKEVYLRMLRDDFVPHTIHYRPLLIAYLHEYVAAKYPNSLLLDCCKWVFRAQYIRQYGESQETQKYLVGNYIKIAESLEAAYINQL